MRFDREIYFQYITEGAFDPSTGDHADPAIIEVRKMADVNDTTRDTLMLVFGELRQGSKTACIQGRIAQGYSRIRIRDRTASKDRIYQVKAVRELERLTTFVLEEVQ